MKEAIIQLFKEKIADFHKYFFKVNEWHEMEDIHQLRLSIKNLKVILSIFELSTKEAFTKKAHFKLFSPLFKSAGRLREAQINMKLVQKLETETFGKYITYINKQESRHLEDLVMEMKSFDLKKYRKLNNKLISKAQAIKDKQLEKTLTKYLQDNIKVIEKIKKNVNGNKGLHDIRIRLKRVEEVLVLLQTISSTKDNEKLLKAVRSSRNKIGKWHDYIVLSSSVNDYFDQTNKRKTKKLAMSIRKEIKNILGERQNKIMINLEALNLKKM